MPGRLLISKHGGMITYGNVRGICKASFKMNELLFIFVIGLISVRVNDAADMDIYQDLPEDYIIEQVANRLQQERLQLQRMHAVDTSNPLLDEDSSEPDFSYQFPPGAEHEVSQFAFRPPDPRYYHDTRRAAGSQEAENVMKPFARQSLLDDDTFDPPPRPMKLSTPAQRDDFDDVKQKDDGNSVRQKDGNIANQNVHSNVASETVNDNNVNLREHLTDSRQAGNNALLDVDAGTHAQVIQQPIRPTDDKEDIYFIAIVAGCSAAAVVGVMVIAISWYKLQRNAKAAADVEYPAYGVTGPNKETSPTGDRKLAQSAQMYHYQHQKQQIIAMENRVANERHDGSMSEAESDEENEEGDYTVYECPGLAPTGEMEVKNPLFLDDPTPAASPATATTNTAPAHNQHKGKSPTSKGEKFDKK